MRAVVVAEVAIVGEPHGALGVHRGDDRRDPAGGRCAAGEIAGDVRPGATRILGHPHEAVVRAGPQHRGRLGALGDGENRVVAGVSRFRRRILARSARHVRPQRFPILAVLAQPEQPVAAQIHGGRVERRDENRGGPVPGEVVAALGARVERGGLDVVPLPRAQVEPRHVAELPPRVHGPRVVGGDLHPHAVAAVHRIPVGVGHADLIPRAARAAPHAVVLEPAADLVGRERAVHDHGVELADRNRHVPPRPARVVGHVRSAVVAEDAVPRVVRVEPQGVMVAVHARQRLGGKGAPAILALEQR